MNELLLRRRLGLASPQAFQRVQYERLLHAVTPNQSIRFDKQRHVDPSESYEQKSPVEAPPQSTPLAHSSGVNVLALDEQTGRFLISGGADSAVRVWDLEGRGLNDPYHLRPVASTTPSRAGAHTHALTSLSIYPFDPSPSTVFTTSYDKTLKISSLETADITSVHNFDLTDTPYSHSLSPIASSVGLIAVGTAHPAVKLLDLRTGLATHTLAGHQGAVFSVCWSPCSQHLLASGAVDGRVLFFDVRRAHSVFAALDLDDALGVLGHDVSPDYTPRPALDWAAKAHNGPVTGVRWFDEGRKLVTCGHDQRIRVWDAATGRNDLVHFGPRIRNQRNGEFNPLISPAECARSSGEQVMFWANQDAKGEIFIMDLGDGTMLKVLQTPGITRSTLQMGGGATGSAGSTKAKLTSAGRINSMAWRVKAASGSAVELYSGHGDGSIHAWTCSPPEDEDAESADDDDDDHHQHSDARTDPRQQQQQRKRNKRKRDLLDGLVDGLVKKPVPLI